MPMLGFVEVQPSGSCGRIVTLVLEFWFQGLGHPVLTGLELKLSYDSIRKPFDLLSTRFYPPPLRYYANFRSLKSRTLSGG